MDKPRLDGLLILGLSLLQCIAGCVERTTITPVETREELYLFLTSQIRTTQTLLENGQPYVPEYLSWCSNLSAPRPFTLADDCPLCDFASLELPVYKYHSDSQILQIYNLVPRFEIDSSLEGIYWWGDAHLRGDCLQPWTDLVKISGLPFLFPNDSTILLKEIRPNGVAVIDVYGTMKILKGGETETRLARRDTVTVKFAMPPDTVVRDHPLLVLDTLLIHNYGLLPKKLILFE